MKQINMIIATVVVLLFCSSVYAQSVVIDTNSLSKIADSVKTSVKEATDDFDAVLNGQLLLHAVVDAKIPLPADGGTTFYSGKGYRLTIVKSLATIGGINGYFYGPIIEFDNKVVQGNSNKISCVRFYSLTKFKEQVK